MPTELSSLTPEEALQGWLLDLKQRRRSPGTIAWYAETVRPFLEWADVSSIAELVGDQLRRYSLLKLSHLSPETLMRRVGAIKALGKWLEEQVKTGKAPVYRYYFALGNPGDRFHTPASGAFHSDDIEYVFGTLDSRPEAMWRPEDRKLSD